MKLRAFALLLSLTLAGCREQQKAPAEAISPDKVAYAGHGGLFDKNFKEIEIDAPMVLTMQDSMLGVISKDEGARKTAESDPLVKQIDAQLQAKDLSPEARLSLNAARIDKMLENASAQYQARYVWRNRAILSHYWNRRDLTATIAPGILALLRGSGAFRPGSPSANYIRDCEAHEVPIPPDWAEKGTPWQRQGPLTTNMLFPGRAAVVWTYSDPDHRGACIALPRDDGRPGSAAGIICQSAVTGHACFWDNKLAGESPERFIGWSGRNLVIADLKNGSNLDSSCTGCHHGNNVYLIAPDDPTWVKVLQGPLNGPSTGTFTTRVEMSPDNARGYPRYVPITTLPERIGWENRFTPNVCAGACHEQPQGAFTFPATMPPACASPTVANCYASGPL